MTKKILLAYGITFVLFFLIGGAIYLFLRNRALQNEINVANIHLGEFKTDTTKLGSVISTQKQNILTLRQAKQLLEYENAQLKDKRIKDATTIIWLETEIERLKIFAHYTDTIIDTLVIEKGADLKTYMKVPKDFSYNDDWFSIYGKVKTTGVLFDSITSFSQPSIVLGYDKAFFKKPVPIIVYSDKNPHSKVLSMNNMVIKQKPPFYKTPWFYRLEGAGIFYGGLKAVELLK